MAEFVRPVAVSRTVLARAQTAAVRLGVPVLIVVGAIACAPTTIDSETLEAAPSEAGSTGSLEVTVSNTANEASDPSSGESPNTASDPTADHGSNDDTTAGGSSEVGSIRFEVEGGYLGLARSIVIAPDGTAKIEVGGRSSTADLEPETVERLRQDLDASDLFATDAVFETEGADLQRYTIEYRGSTVIALDGVVPPELTGPISPLEQLILDNR